MHLRVKGGHFLQRNKPRSGVQIGGGDSKEVRLKHWQLAHTQVSVQSVSISWPQCEFEFDMQTPGRDFNQLSGHNFASGECS